MTYIFLIAAFNAFFFLMLLSQKKSKSLHDRVLIVWLIYLGLSIGLYAFSSYELFRDNTLLYTGIITLFTLHGPFFYLYISSLTSERVKLKRKDFLHFVPFPLFLGYLFISSLFPEYASSIRIDHVSIHTQPPWLFNFFLVMTALSGPVYFLMSIRLFRKLDLNISNNFSYSKDIDLDWLRKLIYIFGVVWTSLMIIAVIHHLFHLFSIDFCLDGLFLSLSAFIILIGYFGLRQREIFVHYLDPLHSFENEVKLKYAGSGLKEEDASHYLRILEKYMRDEKPYLDPQLTLPKLADDLNIPSNYLSQIINENLKQNFFDYINKFRVEEVKSNMADSKFEHYSLLGIAYESGFNSKSAFNRIFKKSTGLTPSAFKKGHKEVLP
jgi:AraC-like DNA-binding protein